MPSPQARLAHIKPLRFPVDGGPDHNSARRSRGRPCSTGSRSSQTARPGRARGCQRRRQDHAPTGDRRRGVAPRRRAVLRKGSAHRPARPASTQGTRRRLRDYVARGAADLVAIEAELPASRGDGRRRARPAHAAPLRRRTGPARARRRLQLARPRGRGAARSRVHRRRFRSPAGDVLRRRADPRLARTRARRRPRPPAPRRAHQPSRRRRSSGSSRSSTVPRRRHRARRPRPLVPGGGATAVLELDGGRLPLLRRAVARVAPREGRPHEPAAKTVARVDADIARLERFVERFRYKKSKAKQAQAQARRRSGDCARNAQGVRRAAAADATPPNARLRVPEARPNGSHGAGGRRTGGFGRKQAPARPCGEFVLERGEHVALVGPNGSGKTTLLETILGTRAAAAGALSSDTASARLLLAARGRARRARTVLACAMATTGLSRPRGQALLGGSSSRAGTRTRSR